MGGITTNAESIFTAPYGDEQVFVKYGNDASIDVPGVSDDNMYRHIAAGIVLDDLSLGPQMEYDEEEDKLYMEDVGTPLEDASEEELAQMDTESYFDVLVASVLIGDVEATPEHITVDGDGQCYPIDFDSAGVGRIRSYGEFMEQVDWNMADLDYEGDESVDEKVDEAAYRIAERLNAEKVVDELRNHPQLEDFDATNYVTNIDWFMNEYGDGWVL